MPKNHRHPSGAKNTPHTCLNCGCQFEGNYCPDCGQSADTRRFTVSSTVRSLIETLSGSDNTFLSTALQLFYRPGHLVREFICGRRARYFRPVQMLLFLITIFVLVSYFIDSSTSPLELLRSSSLDENVNSSSLASALVYIGAFLSNKVTFSLVAALLFVFPFRLLFGKCRVERLDGSPEPLNSAEHFYALIYISCQIMLLSLVMMPLSLIEALGPSLRAISIFAPLFFATWTYCQLYKGHFLRNVLLTFASVLLALLGLALLVILVFGLFYGYDAVR